jgi:hypothetical protein
VLFIGNASEEGCKGGKGFFNRRDPLIHEEEQNAKEQKMTGEGK